MSVETAPAVVRCPDGEIRHAGPFDDAAAFAGWLDRQGIWCRCGRRGHYAEGAS